MTYEKNPFKYENIPDYAMKPAQETAKIDGPETDQFDPTPYDRILGAAESAYDLETKKAQKQYHDFDDIPFNKPNFNWEGIGAKNPVDPYESSSNEIISEDSKQASVETQSDEDSVLEAVDEQKKQISLKLDEEPIAQQSGEVLSQLEEDKVEPVVKPVEPLSDAISQSVAETIKSVSKEKVLPPKEDILVKPVVAPPTKVSPIKVIPIVGSLVSSKLKLVDIKDKPRTTVYIEEDVLVPDVKPDLSTILAIDGKVKLSEKEVSAGQAGSDIIKVTGDLAVETLYLPDTQSSGENIVSIESRLPFKSECLVGAAPQSKLVIYPQIDSIDYSIINERKIRIKATVSLDVKEYGSLDVDLFEGVKGEEVQMLKEKIRVTDVAMRRTEPLEIKEELLLKDSMPEIDRVLKYDMNVVENHKQITKDKAVINASIYCNVMYLGASPNDDVAKASETGEHVLFEPILYQGKTDFTQFIKFTDDVDTENKNLVGSKVDFDINSFSLAKKLDENGKAVGFDLESNIDTTIELYQNIEKEIVTDVYHNVKDIQYETEEVGLNSLSGSGASEVSVREIINIPDKFGPVDHIAYMSADIKETNSMIDNGRSIVEGLATIKLICIASDDNKTVYNIKQEIPFRSSIDIPGAKEDMSNHNQLTLKDLWFDKINNRQIEVNAGVAVSTNVSKEERHKLIKNVSFIETPEEDFNAPSIILYIAKAGDNIWKIAKKYRTTIDEIKKINDLEYANEIKPGTKLLIIAKNH